MVSIESKRQEPGRATKHSAEPRGQRHKAVAPGTGDGRHTESLQGSQAGSNGMETLAKWPDNETQLGAPGVADSAAEVF